MQTHTHITYKRTNTHTHKVQTCTHSRPSEKPLLFAGVHLCPLTAGVTFDVAAPQELAVALPHAGVLVRVVASAATHQVTATDLLHHCLVAHPALRPHAPRHWVCLAVVGGLVYVHQVRIHGFPVGVGLFDLEEFGPLVAAGFDWFHVHRMGILLFENVAQLAELGKCSPAGFGGAGARDAVTLAFQTHVLLQDLTAHFVVVQIHESSGALFDLASVHKHLREAQAVTDVRRAAAPLPALVLTVEALLLLVTAAVTQVALRAGRRDGVGHPGRDDGVGERSLFTAHFQLFSEDCPFSKR